MNTKTAAKEAPAPATKKRLRPAIRRVRRRAARSVSARLGSQSKSAVWTADIVRFALSPGARAEARRLTRALHRRRDSRGGLRRRQLRQDQIEPIRRILPLGRQRRPA